MCVKVHIRKDVFDIDCTRTGEGFGNPFVMNKRALDQNAERNRVCDAHLGWLRAGQRGEHIVIGRYDNLWVLLNMHKLRGKRCACWCKPLRCHVDNFTLLLKEGGSK